MNKKPVGEVFEGDSSEMKGNTPWLSSEDILGRGDVEVTIKACHKFTDVEFEAGRKESTVYSVEFEKASKQLVLNSVNRKSLVAKFGTDVKAWAGKSVKLYVDPNVKLMGKIVNGVRIR